MLSQGGSEAPTARHRHTTVLHDNAMWAYGGMTDLQEKSDFWRFDFGKYLIMKYPKYASMYVTHSFLCAPTLIMHNFAAFLIESFLQ